jgi:alkylation response protein AidB-like acyl-CoA dehydrogenase
MNDDALKNALEAVSEASKDSKQLEIAQAVLIGQAIAQAMQPQQTTQQQVCQHHQPKDRRSAAEWLGIAAAVCVGGVGIAFASLALAILGGVAAIVVLVLRDMWRDIQKHH